MDVWMNECLDVCMYVCIDECSSLSVWMSCMYVCDMNVDSAS